MGPLLNRTVGESSVWHGSRVAAGQTCQLHADQCSSHVPTLDCAQLGISGKHGPTLPHAVKHVKLAAATLPVGECCFVVSQSCCKSRLVVTDHPPDQSTPAHW
eukprot:jgi/Ulvmu1/2588/UM014_0039.1